MADKNGYIENDDEFIKSQILPYQKENIKNNIQELLQSNLVIKCNYIDRELMHIVNFTKHQPIHPHEAQSPYPSIDSDDVIKCNYIQLRPIGNSNSKGNDNSKGSDSKFKKPSINEIQEFCLNESISFDSEYFYNYYESNGWMVGKNRMKNWQATIKQWKARETKQTNQPKTFHQLKVERGNDAIANFLKKQQEKENG